MIGLQHSTNQPSQLLQNSFAALITRLMPNGTAPLFGLSAMLPTATAKQFEHGYWTKSMVFPSLQINNGAGYNAAATTFAVDSSAEAFPGVLYRNQRTGEIVIVNTVPDGVSVTVTRGVGTVAAAAILDNDEFFSVGTAFEEGSVRPTAQSILPARVMNYTQIFRNAWGVTGTAAASDVQVGMGLKAENRQDCAMFHAADIEKAIFFGQKFLGTRNGNPFHTMDGLINIITTLAPTNVTTAGPTTNYTQLETALDPCFNTVTDPKAGNRRVLFTGGAGVRVLNNIGRVNGQYQLIDGQTSYGLQFKTIKLARGEFDIVEHPLFNSNPTWAKMAVAVDLSSFQLAYLGNRKTVSTEYGMNGKPTEVGLDAVGGDLLTELTTQINNPSANSIIYNLTAAAVG